VANHGVVYYSNLFKRPRRLDAACGLASRFRLKKHVVLAQVRQCVRDERTNFLSRNMAQIELESLAAKVDPVALFFPGRPVQLSVLESLAAKVDPVAFFFPGRPVQLSVLESLAAKVDPVAFFFPGRPVQLTVSHGSCH